MAKRNAPDPGTAAREARTTAGDRPLFVVPRRWLGTLAALLVVPWAIAIGLYLRGSGASGARAAEASVAADNPVAVANGASQPWGRLDITPIVISPPLEYVPSNWGPVERPHWYFPGATRPQLEQFLTSVGLSPGETAQLLTTVRSDPRGLIVDPDPQQVRGLAPNVRAEIYRELAMSAKNSRQRDAYRYFGTSSDVWLGGAPITPRTRQLVEPLIYRIGDFVYFADIDLVRPEISDPAELQRLAKRLFREATMMVRLRLEPAQLDAAVEYWGRGGRRTDIRPLLESIVTGEQDHSIDIGHLLPTLARNHLYRYPQVTLGDLDKPGFVNCFWTALNFFSAEPDDRYLDSNYAIERLKRDYFIVHDQFQLGDVAAFVDPEGGIYHAAVYLADGLVFGKNGTSPLSPWTIVPIDRLKGYYPEHADHWEVVFYRRKNL